MAYLWGLDQVPHDDMFGFEAFLHDQYQCDPDTCKFCMQNKEYLLTSVSSLEPRSVGNTPEALTTPIR